MEANATIELVKRWKKCVFTTLVLFGLAIPGERNIARKKSRISWRLRCA